MKWNEKYSNTHQHPLKRWLILPDIGALHNIQSMLNKQITFIKQCVLDGGEWSAGIDAKHLQESVGNHSNLKSIKLNVVFVCFLLWRTVCALGAMAAAWISSSFNFNSRNGLFTFLLSTEKQKQIQMTIALTYIFDLLYIPNGNE